MTSVTTIRDSSYWQPLWTLYTSAPSIAFCRVPELEYAATLNVGSSFLDHCCGDGLFAKLAWPEQLITVGCDLNAASIRSAKRRAHYRHLDVCDAACGLPYRDKSFETVFNNSALEHIFDIDAALCEVARVLRVGGIFAFNVLNHRYFEWWPLSKTAMKGYRSWQPFYHAWSIEMWQYQLERAGLRIISVEGYFGREAARDLAFLDCLFSGHYLAGRRSLFVSRLWKCRMVRDYWFRRLARHCWRTAPDSGAGYFMRAVRVA